MDGSDRLRQIDGHLTSINFGDAVARVLERHPGMELMAVNDAGRLWTAYHETYVFCWAPWQAGEQAWGYRGHRYAASASTTMLIEPGEVHRTLRSSAARFYLLWLHPPTVKAMLDGSPPHFLSGQTSAEIVRLGFAQLCQAAKENPGDGMAMEESSLHFVRAVAEVCAEHVPSRRLPTCTRAVRRVRDYLHESCEQGESVRLDDLAMVAAVSKYHLSRMFTREVGLPIHRYLNLVRLARSQLLLFDGASVCEVAQRFGFHDQAHFHRAFLRVYGVTPGRYRRARR